MSKVFKDFKKHIINEKLYKKFFNNQNPGQRIVPNNNKVENAQHQLRVDAGEVADGHKNIYLQVNSEAKNTALKKFRSKHGTHANIATAEIKVDTPENKQQQEVEEALEEMTKQYRSKIG
ncbi:hypothetical protein BU26DRAFT_79010 [Trematosphaeria pertusa]|uniref:Uncharacterized protein n=1 Tax=Trematosphaeria pertusa TaxID=390896 RepID=A0A6A6I4J2_9PLEO|nr:uncharacterized protein BU26DRAFT_79010 [Trematosphaeria pertusa]KAF2245227.1 hypothetical protein BU26DRAFT_79010 [Trematosphaeria pertusa]